MRTIRSNFFIYTVTLFICLNFCFVSNSVAQVDAPVSANYTFETIDVPGVDFLALTASSDFEDYAGYTKSADSEKEIAFTLIDGVFKTYDFPGSQNTYFYALGNNGVAAGYYEDSDGLHHGVILQNGELQRYDFPGAAQTEIYGISDATGALTGNFIDAAGVRRGFSGDLIIEFPGASATYANFVTAGAVIAGSYIDTEGLYHAYVRTPIAEFLPIDYLDPSNLEYFFPQGVNNAGIAIVRAKAVGDVPRTYVGSFQGTLQDREFQFPGSVSTEGWHIHQDGSVVGHYDTADGRRHGFIARPKVADTPLATSADFTYTYESIDVPGVDFLALTASSDFEDYAGYTRRIDSEKEIAFTLIDGVFKTYDFPGSQKTHFYALGNNGRAAGHYQDSNGLYHGVIVEPDGAMRQYDFPDAVQTEIYGISDATGALTGNFIDAFGVRRGFSGDIIVEVPGASATYADFVNESGFMVGSYVNAEGIYKAYVRAPNNTFVDYSLGLGFEYLFIHGLTDSGILVGRSKEVDDVPRTYVMNFQSRRWAALQFPGSVSTEGWNINQDGSVVGYYDSADGRRHGFIARPVVDTTPQVNIEPVDTPADSKWTFESIHVDGIEFLALTASSDFGDYAGYTKSADGQKEIAFTLIDGVFTTYDFPDAQNTYFYALGNDGRAAGHYQDSNGLFHGVILEDGELQRYDFPNSVQTEIYGISDSTGALTGNFIDASGIRRGFSGDEIIEFPGAPETYADFVNASGSIVGSYVDADGLHHVYMRTPDGRFVSLGRPSPQAANIEYIFVHGISDAGVIVSREKLAGRVPHTSVGTFQQGLRPLKVPGSVSTEGWNINQDGSIVGYYDSADGRRHGFIARPAPDAGQPVGTPTSFNYTFEGIDVPGVDFLAVTASSDFEDYAGYTKSADGQKEIAFTLIDGVFTTYDFPGSQNTYFYALGNNGQAAGHYQDSEGLYHGVVLEKGELRQYDFPGAVQTEIFGISDATGALTGNFIDASGIRRGFSGDEIIEFPGAPETYADFVNASGRMVGSYVDADGLYYSYARTPDGNFIFLDLPLPQTANIEYIFVHGISDAGVIVARGRLVGGVPRTYVGSIVEGLHELQFPGSVSTEGWNINQDGSVVGHYNSPDGRRHGFIARLGTEEESDAFSNAYTVKLSKGLNMLSVPLASPKPMTAKSLAGIAGATVVIALDAENQRFIGWTPDAPNDGFPIEGGQGYIVNVPQSRKFAFVGAPWTDQTEAAAAPAISQTQEAWAFVVSGQLEGILAFEGYQVIVRNLRTNRTITTSVQGNYFAAVTADLARRSVVRVGDVIELRVIGPGGNVESQTLSFKVTPQHLANAVLPVNLDSIGQPQQNQLLQNYPNPFNPETWIPYQLSQDSPVSVSIYDTTGKMIRTLSIGYQSAGFYNSQDRAAYWDGKNALGERVASGVYFYTLTAGEFTAIRKMLIRK